MVQCIPELFGSCHHVHILPVGDYHWQGRKEEEEIPLVGQVLDTIPNIPICQHAGPGGI